MRPPRCLKESQTTTEIEKNRSVSRNKEIEKYDSSTGLDGAETKPYYKYMYQYWDPPKKAEDEQAKSALNEESSEEDSKEKER